MLTQEYDPVSESEYLRLEARSPVRHEYLNGELFAMTGGTLRHNTIAVNLTSALKTHLRNTECRPYLADVRVRVASSNAYYYPDVLVVCDGASTLPDLTSTTIHDPRLIIEVLSEPTSVIDKREKLAAYRSIASVAEYVLVSQDEACVEIYRRKGDIGWMKIDFGGAETVRFESVDMEIDMRKIYEGIVLII